MENRSKIQHLSTLLFYTCYSLIAFWVVFIIWTVINIWYYPDSLQEYMSDHLLPTLLRMGDAAMVRGVPSAMIFFLPSMFGLYGLWRLNRLFDLYRRGIYFTRENVDHLFIFALIAVLNHLLGTPIAGVADYVLTIGVPEIPYGMPLQINGDEVSNLLLYSAFLTISWIMKEAISIEKENAEFV